MLFMASCAERPPAPPAPYPGSTIRTQRPYQIKGIWYYPIPSAEGYVEDGIASWYGSDFHGKPTSCGETYDMNAMTAAHKTLPLGTYVKVTHLDTNRSIIVRVNDRGPFVAGRIIDLSCRAAQELGTAQKGLARVRVEAVQVAAEEHMGQNTYWKVNPMPSLRYGNFMIQIGAFREQANAYRLREKMVKGGQEIQVYPYNDGGDQYYRVQVGVYKDLVLARREMERLRQSGFNDAFVVAMEDK
ncbi:MAG: septal ring lytic transglycosylase RlpA family protein [Deltaproteobacteria bacterium]|jgi:rare lipoprotein A|nr:septal ring lytic transglycosylase RlpA family protein [Deltaproteobacteria bacterium]